MIGQLANFLGPSTEVAVAESEQDTTDSPYRKLTAHDLIAEWDKAVHHDYASKIGGKSTIAQQTAEFLKECNRVTYEYDVFKKYESIVQMVDDNDVYHRQMPENRPCHNRRSKLHKLNCGHYVYTETNETPCGVNCAENNVSNDKAFFCTLCVRHTLDFTKVKQSRRWHDLLLPIYIKKAEELAWWMKESDSMRKVEPAYLDPYDFILLPRIHCTIAMVIAYEIRKEEEMKQAIIGILEPKAAQYPAIAAIGLEFFEHCLVFQQVLDNVDASLLAGLSIQTILFHYGICDFNPVDLMNALCAPHHPHLEELYNIIINSM
jgi:hypothetical protein